MKWNEGYELEAFFFEMDDGCLRLCDSLRQIHSHSCSGNIMSKNEQNENQYYFLYQKSGGCQNEKRNCVPSSGALSVNVSCDQQRSRPYHKAQSLRSFNTPFDH